MSEISENPTRPADNDAYPLEGWVAAAATDHRLDSDCIGCRCGFAVWSGTHVAIMSYREAADATRRITPPGEGEPT